ncbi:hypothetical protein [Microcoleus asticus]|nr:hypothetical protein [Microcoleus asticus]
MVQLTETGDRTSRSSRAIVPNASLASFAVSEALEEDRPPPIRTFCQQAHPLTLTGCPKH